MCLMTDEVFVAPHGARILLHLNLMFCAPGLVGAAACAVCFWCSHPPSRREPPSRFLSCLPPHHLTDVTPHLYNIPHVLLDKKQMFKLRLRLPFTLTVVKENAAGLVWRNSLEGDDTSVTAMHLIRQQNESSTASTGSQTGVFMLIEPLPAGILAHITPSTSQHKR